MYTPREAEAAEGRSQCRRVRQATPIAYTLILRLVLIVPASRVAALELESTVVLARDSVMCARSTLHCLAGLSLLWSGCAQISVGSLRVLHGYDDSNCVNDLASEQTWRAAASLAQASVVARVPNVTGTIVITSQTNQVTLLSNGFTAGDDSTATIPPPAQPHSAAVSVSVDVATHCSDALHFFTTAVVKTASGTAVA